LYPGSKSMYDETLFWTLVILLSQRILLLLSVTKKAETKQ